jgi:Transcriptional regulator
MSRPSPSRDRLLDAFEAILIDDGERTATLDAVAARAGVSKGGLLYHFGSKDALVSGLLERLAALVADDVTNIETAPEGSIEYLLRTSVATQSPLERTIMACTSLAQGSNERVRAALRDMQDAWFTVVRKNVDDPVIARVISLVSDGLYFNSMLRPEAEHLSTAELDGIITFVSALRRG